MEINAGVVCIARESEHCTDSCEDEMNGPSFSSDDEEQEDPKDYHKGSLA